MSDFPLTLARWPMASELCRRTSDFLSYWPGLACGISKIVEKFKKKKDYKLFLFLWDFLFASFYFKGHKSKEFY